MLSSAYRQWVRTAPLELPEGESAPPFSEVWVALSHAGKRERSVQGGVASPKDKNSALDGQQTVDEPETVARPTCAITVATAAAEAAAAAGATVAAAAAGAGGACAATADSGARLPHTNFFFSCARWWDNVLKRPTESSEGRPTACQRM
mmetsp:Transcript_89754/g.178443  ORF Transcript_89754/g.178443 Transcript_89754/m.178443 type:complete len:149 (-) Transcript_89754:976-1422(-)